MIKVGLNPKLIADHFVEDRLSAGRHVLQRSWFHPRCADAVEILSQYQYEYDEKAQTFHKVPKQNFASHIADAFGYSAMAYREEDLVRLPGAKGRATLIHAPEIGNYQSDRAQVTLDDLWRKHKEDLNKARRGR
jgi:hypothetical protein